MPRCKNISHCNRCNNCIYGMDHHCVFLGKCIGINNHRCFYIFMFAAAFASQSIAISSILHIFMANRKVIHLCDFFIFGVFMKQ